MSVALKLTHVDGIRLRHQSRQEYDRVVEPEKKTTAEDGTETVTPAKTVKDHRWVFDKFFRDQRHTEDIDQDRDYRRIGADGQKELLGTYSVHITYNLKNLVIERKGPVKSFDFKNPSIRNSVRIQYQKLVPVLDKKGEPKTRDGKPVMEWKNEGIAQFIPPNTFGGAYVGDGQRAILDEMPT